MLETKPLIANVGLGMHEFRKALPALREQGWTPAILESEREFLRLAGVDEDLPLRSEERAPRPSALGGRHTGCGELFFRGEDLYYCVCMSGVGRMLSEPAGDRPALEVGLITRNTGEVEKRLRTFAAAVEMAVRKAVDSAKAQDMTFEWAAPKPDRSRLAALEKTEREGRGARFGPLRLDREVVRGAAALAEPLARDILAEAAAAGFVRARDAVAAKRPDPEAVQSALDKLRKAGLISLEHLLECKKYGTPLTRLSEPGKLETAEVGALVCPSCGVRFSEEAVCEGYSVSDLGQRLSRNAHWLTVLMMYRLAELGVPSELMLWNVSQPGEDVDIAVQFLGQFWTFELKDREFGAQEALGFNYRRARYCPQKAFVVTTQKVSVGAKRLFQELSGGELPVFLEGLSKASDALRGEVYAAELNYACGRLRVVEELTGYDVAGVIAARFGEKAAARKPPAEPGRDSEPPAAARRSQNLAARLQQRSAEQKK